MNALHSTSAALETDRAEWRPEGARIKTSPAMFYLLLSGLTVLFLGGRTLAASASLSAGTTNPAVGQTFAVTVNLAGASGFACWGAAVRYDGAKLALVSQTNGSFGTFVTDSRGSAAMNASGQSRTGGYGMSNNAGGAGTLAVLTFQTLAEGVTTIAMDPQSAGSPFGLALYSTNGTVAIPSVGAPLTIVIGGGDPNLDSDADGIPDWWMLQHFGHATGQAWDLSRAADDPDGDGMSNWQEWEAGTVPTNGLSLLIMTDVAPNPGAPGEFIVRWQSASNRWYTLQAATNLLTGFNLNLRTNIPATPPDNVYTDSVESAVQKFYRMNVE